LWAVGVQRYRLLLSAVHIVFWDLDKTYLRTEFDTVKDLLRTAFERADEKRTHPGAMTLMRELRQKGGKVHILSGSPEQMRSRLETKLRLDGVEWDSFTLKPNLRNILKFRFRALRDQLGYKLPALLDARARLRVPEDDLLPRETLVGDDAEADAFIYSLYADFLSGRVSEEMLFKVLSVGETYEDVIERVRVSARKVAKGEIVERIMIHLEGQSSPERFKVYGPRVVPFYNYLQAALIVFEDARVSAHAVMRVAVELVLRHRFSGEQLARSYAELAKRGHLRSVGLSELADAAKEVGDEAANATCSKALATFAEKIASHAPLSTSRFTLPGDAPVPDYANLVLTHNPRKKRKTLF
jgi:hypothetical protein